MNKYKYAIIIIVVSLLIGFAVFMNYDTINNYINNKQWEVADAIARIYPDKLLQTGSSGDKLLVIENDKISAYTNSVSKEFSFDINLKDVVVDSNRDYCIVGEKGGNKLVLINEKGKAWYSEVAGEILIVSVNKNGYVAVVYSKSGYKSVIKVFNPEGNEVLTNYLATTYALDVEISADNKYLAIAEVNTEGINIESNIKIVDISNATSETTRTVKLDSNTMILDVEFTAKNELVIMEDSRVEIILDSDVKRVIKEFDHNNVMNVNIEDGNDIVIIEKIDTGIFSTEYVMKLYGSSDEEKECELDTSVELVRVLGKTICANTGNQVLFFNTNGKLFKRFRVEGQVRDIKLYNNGLMAAIVYRDRIEIIKL